MAEGGRGQSTTMLQDKLRTDAAANDGTTPSACVYPAPDRIIVVSDLHLGEGVDPIRGSASGEHFFHDHQFEVWLDRLTRRAARRRHRLELVLNGDVFDFLRVVRLPDTPQAVVEWLRMLVAARVRHVRARLRRAARGCFSFRERAFGLGTDEPSCVWKLAVIAAAHRPVFRALANFCRAGHSLVIIRGNHDPDWAWPGVQRAFLVLLRRAGAHGLRQGQVRFESVYYQRANVYIEHGHVVDWLTCEERDMTEGEPPGLRLPFGSLISRYVLNALERRIAPGDSVPPSRRLADAIRQRPWRMVPLIATNTLRAIPFIGWSGWKRWFEGLMRWWPARVSVVTGAALLAAAPLAPLIGARRPLQGYGGYLTASLFGFGLPLAGFMMREIVAQTNSEALIAEVRNYARRLATRLRGPMARCRYVILGHTHRVEACEWTGAADAVVYLNPGAWLPPASGPAGDAVPRFVWLARRGDAYVRHRLLPLDAVAR
jgi:UDP-2,3-diacylglucosamine pyrophosphatase LpxH